MAIKIRVRQELSRWPSLMLMRIHSAKPRQTNLSPSRNLDRTKHPVTDLIGRGFRKVSTSPLQDSVCDMVTVMLQGQLLEFLASI